MLNIFSKNFRLKLVSIALLLAPVFIILGFVQSEPEASDSCNPLEAKQKCKEALRPNFQYDATKSTKFTLNTKKQFKELEVPLYIGEKYRFAFSTSGMPQAVDIEIYDKDFESSKRKLLFTSKSFPDQNLFTYDTQGSLRKVFLDYTTPPTTDSVKKGCVVFVLGYKTKG